MRIVREGTTVEMACYNHLTKRYFLNKNHKLDRMIRFDLEVYSIYKKDRTLALFLYVEIF